MQCMGKLTLKEYDMLEKVQHDFCKKVQGFHPRTPSVTAADVIGVKPTQCYMEKRTLLFLVNYAMQYVTVFLKRLLLYFWAKYSCYWP